jgi:hypothetical protein
MELKPAAAHKIAQEYFRTTDQLLQLGCGISGFVYLSPDPRAAVKIHDRQESFETELKAYHILSRLLDSRLHGLSVPKLIASRRDVKLIEMEFVAPPYLLDFAGVQFSEPDFSAEVQEYSHRRIVDGFGPNASVAYAVYDSLAKMGIYYLDFKPSNMNLKGLPGLQPYERLEDDPSAASPPL